MTYEQALNYIHSLNKFGINPGLERIEALCAAVGNPQNKLNFVHIAGTNGKGSTSTMVARALSYSGKKTGLFTSPFVTDFRERICVDGDMVDKELFAQVVTELEPVVTQLAQKQMQPTEFEVITAAAFMVFERSGCDICVLEVGLGGRLDSTNVIPTPLVSVIASISLDHTAILGDTVEQIAAEKCGIIKQKGKTVCYPVQQVSVEEIIRETCSVKNNTFTKPDIAEVSNTVNHIDGVSFVYRGVEYNLSMSGEYQVYNAVTALETCLLLGIDALSIKRGIESARVPARMEVISSSPLVLLDGGHNDDGGKAVATSISTLLADKRITAVVGMMADKNVDAYLSCVAPLCSKIVACSVADNPRTMSADELCKLASKYCDDCVAVERAEDAVSLALGEIDDYDCLLVCGSLYLAGEVRMKLINYFSANS
ncbi:MAG: bifunctional folylpolyglutamate synthase/dihydrofolate synthase [Clostridia bacterium]|nr:bifunctional folylpolyglutamate synthase/dihydrofolate synthase [Clostridia bacterium]